MADLVGPDGLVVGVDRDPVMLAEARARTARHGLVEIRGGDVHDLPLPDGSVDRARTDRVLQALLFLVAAEALI
jgi:ubiquinone/menaquinone biosynthesis C-methylase UbiE